MRSPWAAMPASVACLGCRASLPCLHLIRLYGKCTGIVGAPMALRTERWRPQHYVAAAQIQRDKRLWPRTLSLVPSGQKEENIRMTCGRALGKAGLALTRSPDTALTQVLGLRA